MRKKDIKRDKSCKKINNRLDQMKKTFNREKDKDIKSAIINAKREIDEIYLTLNPSFDFVVYRYNLINKTNDLFGNINVVLIAVIASALYSFIERASPLFFNETKLSGVLVILAAMIIKTAIYSVVLILIFLAVVALLKQIAYGKKNDYESFIQPYELETLHRIIESQTEVKDYSLKVHVKRKL